MPATFRQTILSTKTELGNLVAEQPRFKRKYDGLIALDEDIRGLVEGVVLKNEGLVPSCDVYMDGWQYSVTPRKERGGYGTVDLCIDKTSQREFARKVIPRRTFKASEVDILLRLNNKHTVQILGFIGKEHQIEIFQEHAGISLRKFILNDLNEPTDKGMIWQFTYQALCGLCHLDKLGVNHNDIKPDNLCVMNSILKIIDFGSATTAGQNLTFGNGLTPEYMSPEAWKAAILKLPTGYNITGKTDVFSLSLVIYFMFYKKDVLVPILRQPSVRKDIYLYFSLIEVLSDIQKYIAIPQECNEELRYLLLRMTVYDPENRISAEDGITFMKAQRSLSHKRTIEDVDERLLKKKRTEEVKERRRANVLPRLTDTFEQSSCSSLVNTSQKSDQDTATCVNLLEQQKSQGYLQPRTTVMPSGNLPNLQLIETEWRPPPKPRKRKAKKQL